MSPFAGRPTRREFVAAGAGGIVVALAGCTRASEYVVEFFVGDVNLFNTTDRRLAGSLELVDPDGTTLLDERLDLPPDGDGEPAAIFEDTLTTAGSYRIAVETADAREETTIRVRDPGAEHVVVFLGGRLTGEPISISVVEDFAELEDDLEG